MDSIAGQVDIELSVETNARLLQSVQATLTCGSKSVSAQRTDLDAAPAPQPAVAVITLSINTLQVDATGARTLPNGACTLNATPLTTSGALSQQNSLPVVLKNTN